MNKTSLALQAHIASELTTLATCYKITRKDKQLIGFTDHVDDLIYANLTYHNASGFSASALTTHASLAVDHMEVEAVFSHPLITSEDILSGRYDHAELEVFRVNYQDLAQGQLYVKRGWLGEVRLSGGKFSAEIRSLAAALTNSTAQLVSATCRAQFADKRCTLAAEKFSVTGAVSSVQGSFCFSDMTRHEAPEWFSGGMLRFLSGANAGQKLAVAHFSTQQFQLLLPPASQIQVGDRYRALAGCNKQFATCRSKFGNQLNFRGEPHLPGIDRLLQVVKR